MTEQPFRYLETRGMRTETCHLEGGGGGEATRQAPVCQASLRPRSSAPFAICPSTVCPPPGLPPISAEDWSHLVLRGSVVLPLRGLPPFPGPSPRFRGEGSGEDGVLSLLPPKSAEDWSHLVSRGSVVLPLRSLPPFPGPSPRFRGEGSGEDGVLSLLPPKSGGGREGGRSSKGTTKQLANTR